MGPDHQERTGFGTERGDDVSVIMAPESEALIADLDAGGREAVPDVGRCLFEVSGCSTSRGEASMVRNWTCRRSRAGSGAGPSQRGPVPNVGWVTATAAKPRRMDRVARQAAKTRTALRKSGLMVPSRPFTETRLEPFARRTPSATNPAGFSCR